VLHLKTFVLLLALLTAPCVSSAEQLDSAGRLRIGGSGGTLATLQLLAQAFQKNHNSATIAIVPSLGSSGGIKAVLAGATDLAAVSRPLKEAERAQGAIATSYGRTPFVFATAIRMNISAISLSELLGIYSGEHQTWPDGRALRLVLRPESESDTDIAKSLSPAMNQAVKTALARPGMLIEPTDQTSAHSLESIPGAIGTITLAQLISEQRTLQPLALNGVIPSVQTLSNGRYPYSKTFSFVSLSAASPLARQFIDFVHSPAGRQILEKNGQLPVTGE
jgi:phosphate transport system substrate-binding protein